MRLHPATPGAASADRSGFAPWSTGRRDSSTLYKLFIIRRSQEAQNRVSFVESLFDLWCILRVLGFVVSKDYDGAASVGPTFALYVMCGVQQRMRNVSASVEPLGSYE